MMLTIFLANLSISSGDRGSCAAGGGGNGLPRDPGWAVAAAGKPSGGALPTAGEPALTSSPSTTVAVDDAAEPPAEPRRQLWRGLLRRVHRPRERQCLIWRRRQRHWTWPLRTQGHIVTTAR